MRGGRLSRVGFLWLVLLLGYGGMETGEAVTTPSVVISQVYGAGGNSGALYRHDFIELFNRGSATVDLSGWAVHYASATGTSWQRTLLGGTLQPGQRYLIQQASGGGSGIALPTPDGVGTIAMAATAGKVLLTSTDTVPGPSSGCPAGLTVIDLVGYGSSASCFEGSARGPAPGSTTAIARREGGCTDSDQNGSDFALQAPFPRNRSTPPAPCNAPTLPQVTAQAVPDPVLAGSVVLLVAAVTPGERPASTGIQVAADLRPLGGAASFSLLDDGQQGDANAGDGQYARTVLLPADLTPGARSLPVRVVDDQGRVGETLLPLTIAPPLPASPVVISQIFAGGGNSGAPYTHDWVELFHRGEAPLDLTGWSLQYASATSGTWTATPLAGRIDPGQFYLIRLASSGTAGIAPPPPDATGTVNLSSTGGKIALSNQTTPLTGPCPVSGGRVDFVGYGSTTNCFEGERAAPDPQSTGALLRRERGCNDSDQNGSDFALQAPLPRNRSTPPAPCNAPTLPQVTAQAVPDPVLAGSVVLLVAAVTPGERPASTGIQVAADLRPLGGAASFSLLDDGQQGDANAGDGQYARTVLLPADLTPGARSLPVRVVDDQGRVGETLLPLTIAPPLPASPVVISQIFAGGGNSGAPYTHDWVELFHRGEAPLDLAGWSLQYASATSGTWTATPLAGRIEPGQFYLIRLASSGTAGIAPPAPDASGTVNLSSSGGKIALSNQTTPLTGTCPVSGGRVDFVGYGSTANCFEGERAAPDPQATGALLRRERGCNDSDQNGSDFVLQAPLPRNRSTPPAPCNAPTLPQVTAQAVPDPVLAGSVVLLVAAVTPGERPASTGIQVAADLRPLGGAASFSLLDDGQQGDANAGDGQYARTVLLPADLTPGARSLPVRVVDDQGRVGETLLPLTIAPPLPASSVVISQIFAGGGNSGAPYTHDWVELFHRGEAPLDLTGWSLQYASATSGTWTATPLAGRIDPGQYYLIRLASSGTAGIAPPPPDASGTVNLSSSGGKIALSNQTTPLTGTCPVSGGRVDFVGYGSTANCFEGERPAAAPQTSAALLRGQVGCTDRDQNGKDWAVGSPRPRNRASPTENCRENEEIARRAVSAQHPGSILLFPLYSSRSARPVQENTRLSITNTHPRDPVRLHLFWMDGGSASMADYQTCLTPNQTVSLLASDLDPDISGFLLVLAVDPISGCPIRFNFLIGEALVKLESGHRANLAALSIAAFDREPAVCSLTTPTVTLSFDGLHYQSLPTTLAASHLPSPRDGQQTLLILVRIGGNLGTGGSTIGTVYGWIYDDLEQPARFGLSIGRRQLRSFLNDSFPRTTPRLSTLIPPSRSGWMRIAQRDGGALIGALLVASSGEERGIVGGRLLHTLGLTTSVDLVMPLVTSGGQACGGGG